MVWPHSPGAAFGQCPRAAARSPTRSGERIEVGMADEATPITSGSAANRRMKDAWTNTWSATAANAKAAAYGQAGRREPSILQHLGLVDRGPKWRAEWGEPVPLDRRAWLSLTPAGSPVRAGRRPRKQGAGGGFSGAARSAADWWTMLHAAWSKTASALTLRRTAARYCWPAKRHVFAPHIAHLPETGVAAAASPDAFLDNDKHMEKSRLLRSSRRGSVRCMASARATLASRAGIRLRTIGDVGKNKRFQAA